MAFEIVIPRLGWSMEEGTFIGWLKSDGDFVRRGEALFELEGEKALQEIEAVDEGILRIPPTGPQRGDVLKVGAVVGYLAAAGDEQPWLTSGAVSPVGAAEGEGDRAGAGEITPELPMASVVLADVGSKFASPRARRIAADLGVDWQSLTGSGANGRIRECDVRAYVGEQSTTNAAGERGASALRGSLPLTSRRRVIAQRLLAGRQQTVPVTLTTKADATQLVNLRNQFQSVGRTTDIPSYQDIITKLVAEVLSQHLLLAGRWEEDALRVPAADGIHIGMAVDTPDGLLVPVLRNVRQASLADVAKQSRTLIQQARAGQLTAADMQGGVFTITNLGAFGIEYFTPVLNSPESAILGLGTIGLEPVVLADGQIVPRQQLALSLTFDHRIVDGAPAARFLQGVVAAIANPLAWLG